MKNASSIDRFLIKTASFSSVFPAVAAPAVGGFAGRMIGARYHAPDIGMLLGGITGGTAGQLIKEKVENAQPVPPGAPYAIDPASADIPPWALQGAQLLQPAMKQGNHGENPLDVVLGEIPGATVVQEGRQHGLGAGARALGGVTAGGVGGGLLGMGLGHGIEHLLNHGQPVRVPGINMSIGDLLGSVGGAIGATKGLRYMRS